MPTTRRTTTVTRYRRRRRPRRRRKRKARVPRRRLRYGFPKNYTCKLRYCETISFDPNATSTPVYAFRCNGPYDPDVTSTGHQPAGYDQLAQMYGYYSVQASKITAKIVGAAATGASVSQALGIHMGVSPTLPPNAGTVANLVESGPALYNTWTMLKVDNPTGTRRLNMMWSPRRSKKLAYWDNDENTANTSSGLPTRQDYYVVYATNNGLGLENPVRFDVLIQVDYVVKFTGHRATPST